MPVENDASVELLRDAFGRFSGRIHFLAYSKWNFASTVTESRKPRRDLSSMKVVVQVRCDQNPKANLSPDMKMCSYVEEVL